MANTESSGRYLYHNPTLKKPVNLIPAGFACKKNDASVIFCLDNNVTIVSNLNV